MATNFIKKKLQIRRNSSLFKDKDLAMSYLKTMLSSDEVKEGELLYATYIFEPSDLYSKANKIGILMGAVGLKDMSDETSLDYQIFEPSNIHEDGSFELPVAIQAKFDSLDFDEITGLDGVDKGKVVMRINQIDGLIDAKLGDVEAKYVLVEEIGDLGAKNAQDALNNMHNEIVAMELAQLNGSANGQFIQQIKQTHGKVTASLATPVAQYVNATKVGEGTSTNVQGILEELHKELHDTVNSLDADVTGKSTHVTVQVVEENGVITNVNVSESDIANASDLTAEIAARKAVDGQSGQTYSANASSNYLKQATSLNDADLKLDSALKGVSDLVGTLPVSTQITNAINTLDATVDDSSTHVTVKVVETDGKLTSITVSESDIANASDLTAEIAARKAVDGQSGQTYSANASSNYLKQATSLNDADLKLDSALKGVSDLVGTTSVSVQITNAINGLDKSDTAVATQYVSSVSETDGIISVGRTNILSSDSDQALTLNSGSIYLSKTIDCGEY